MNSELDQRTLKQIVALVDQGIAIEVNLTRQWQKLHREYDLGVVRAKVLSLSTKDISILQRWVSETGVSGFDPSSRMCVAKTYSNEKLSTTNVLGRHVLCSPLIKPFVINNESFPANRAGLFEIDEILFRADVLVYIENLAVFMACHQYPEFIKLFRSFAEKDQCVVCVYRGDVRFSLNPARQLVDVFQGLKIGFFDFDLAGINQLGHDGFDSLVLPAWDKIDILHWPSLSRKDVFEKQLAKFEALTKQMMVHPQLGGYAGFILQKGLAVMSEVLLAKSIKLELINIQAQAKLSNG
ncbi:DUF7281 domain-containing protein [Thiomicrospira microaerophila]|uniref:DUF7281 domain-containing protein n=1 Tax=Thiomicrospira microaerophila TaxID=406020 RepID=UPI0005CA95C0|nr:hypothetical protein [Thiomicrospira microaerophila]